MYKEGNLTTEKLREAAVAWKDVFEEIPINIRNSPLATALVASIEADAVADTRDFERLNMGVGPLLEKNLEFLNDCMDDIVAEQQKVCHMLKSGTPRLAINMLVSPAGSGKMSLN